MAETRARHAEYTLEWPIEHEGRAIDRITLHHLTGGEVADLQERMIGDGASDAAMIAAFADQPAEVIAARDADDFLELKDMVIGFLPRRIREAVERAVAADPEQS